VKLDRLKARELRRGRLGVIGRTSGARTRTLRTAVAMVVLVVVSMAIPASPAIASQASWQYKNSYTSGTTAQSGANCALYFSRAGYVNYVKGQSGSPDWDCWVASTVSTRDSSLFSATLDYFSGTSTNRIGQADKSYAQWNNWTGSGTYQLYTLSNCGGAVQSFSSSWTSSTHWSAYKKSTVSCG